MKEVRELHELVRPGDRFQERFHLDIIVSLVLGLRVFLRESDLRRGVEAADC